MILIPSLEKQWRQNNQSDILGNIWASFNLDLNSNLGRLRISPRLMVQTTAELDNMTSAPCAFRLFPSTSPRLWTVSGSKVFHTPVSPRLTTDFSAAALGSDPTTADVNFSDLEVFNNKLYVTLKAGSSNVISTDGTTWGTAFSAGTAGAAYPASMVAYGSDLYVGIANKIYAFNTSEAADTGVATSGVLTIGNNSDLSVITFLRAASDRIWIGTLNLFAGKGHIYEWNGSSNLVTRSFRLESQGALACVIKDDIPWVIDTYGRLLVFNGATFKVVARLGTDNVTKPFLVNAVSQVNNRFIHPNGMSLIDGKINLLVSGQNADVSAGSFNENFPSGVWEYDEKIGLYHKYSPSYYDDFNGAITDFGQQRFFTTTDAGATVFGPVGALSELKLYPPAFPSEGSFLAGISYYTDATTQKARVFVDNRLDTIQKSGYFVTTWIDSQNVQDSWQKIFVTYKQLLNSTDKIILKYRTTEATPSEISITWVDTTHFTTATDISGKVGQEVEVVQGTGSGLCSHITAVTGPSGGLYTATVDETYTGVETGTAKARLQAWVKLGTVQNQTEEWSQFPIGKHSPRIQLKCFLLVTGKNELHRLALINQAQRPLA